MDRKKAKLILSKIILAVLLIGLIAAFTSAVCRVVNFDEEPSLQTNDATHGMANDNVVISNKPEHTMWFMQISDIHLSMYYDPKRKTEFFKFCTEVVDVIKPTLVVASGDLTDASFTLKTGSTQHEEEWKMYAEVVRDSNVTTKTIWLDTRGNHDTFNVYNWTDSKNFYQKYSIQGPRHQSHYSQNVKHGSEEYTFISIDSCLVHGPKPPFNVFGLVHDKDIAILDAMKHNASNSNMTIWFGHYPTSSVAAPTPGLREVINGPYLCGHYHVEKMYATQVRGFLEAELADFRSKRKFRVAAVDHGLFVFSDVTLNSWPIIVITNPKPVIYSMPKYEPVGRIRKSTFIRSLVWSKAKLVEVKVKINDSAWMTMDRVDNGPLYVAAWEPSDYKSGLHTITILATDEDNGEQTMSHQFSFDGTRPLVAARDRLLVRRPFEVFERLLFFSVVLLCVAPLLTLRLVDGVGKRRWLRSRLNKSQLNGIIGKFYLLSCCNSLFLPAIAIPLYATFGPWFVGQVIDGHWGVCFIWGMYVEGSLLPGGFTYVLAALFLTFVHLPLMVTFAHIHHLRYRELFAGHSSSTGSRATLCHARHFVVGFVLLIHLLFSLIYLLAYGLVAWLFGILHTWTLFVYLFMWRRASCAEVGQFRATARRCVAAAQEKKSDDNGLPLVKQSDEDL